MADTDVMDRGGNRAHERKPGASGPPIARGRDRAATPGFQLTPRETEVLGLVLRGGGNKEIAAALGVAEQTIKKYVSSLLEKFDVPNRAALAEAGSRFELTGQPVIDRRWVRQLFLEAEPQICVLR
jgi:DNA-binding NarL/FixJ family response regulator